MKVVLADAGALVALCHPRDLHHRWALARFSEMQLAVLTCESALSEALHLLEETRHGGGKLRRLWERGLLTVAFSAGDQRDALLALMEKYADVPMSLADAGLVRMSELHAACAVWTLDRHFRLYRRHGRLAIPLIAPWQA